MGSFRGVVELFRGILGVHSVVYIRILALDGQDGIAASTDAGETGRISYARGKGRESGCLKETG